MYIQERELYTLKLTEIENLLPDQWRSLFPSERLKTLQECEQRISEFEGRPEAKVVSSPLPATIAGWYDQKNNTIHISEAILLGYERSIVECPDGSFKTVDIKHTVYTAFDVLIHEAAHAYQHQAKVLTDFHQNKVENKEWKEGFKLYDNPDYHLNPKLYDSIPNEIHANAQGSLLSTHLRREHEVMKSVEKLEEEVKSLKLSDEKKEVNREKSNSIERLELTQTSENKYQIEFSSGKSFEVNVPKGKSLEEIMTPNFISQMNDMEKGKEAKISIAKELDRPHLTVDPRESDRKSAGLQNSQDNNQQKKKDRDFER